MLSVLAIFLCIATILTSRKVVIFQLKIQRPTSNSTAYFFNVLCHTASKDQKWIKLQNLSTSTPAHLTWEHAEVCISKVPTTAPNYTHWLNKKNTDLTHYCPKIPHSLLKRHIFWEKPRKKCETFIKNSRLYFKCFLFTTRIARHDRAKTMSDKFNSKEHNTAFHPGLQRQNPIQSTAGGGGTP